MNTLLCLLAWLCLLTTMMPFIHLDYWWIRVWDFPRLQILLLGLITLATSLFFWKHTGLPTKMTLAGLVLCLLFQATKIYPYTPFASPQVAEAHNDTAEARLTMLLANVLMENREAQRLLHIIRDVQPDIVLTVETDAWWESQLRSLENEYIYTVKQPQDNHYGMILYSRLRLISPEIQFLVHNHIPSIHTQVVPRSGPVIWLHCLHPQPPSPTGAHTSTQRDAELLIVGKKARQEGAAIVTGDLNDVAWSYTTTLFQKASGLLDPRIGRGLYNSYHAKNIFMRWPLDHIFHSHHFLLSTLRLLPSFGSDHFPVYIALSLAPQAQAIQDKPEADAHDKDQIQKKIERVEQRDTL